MTYAFRDCGTYPHSRAKLGVREPAIVRWRRGIPATRSSWASVSELRIDHGPGYQYYCGAGPTDRTFVWRRKSTQSKDIAEAMELAANWTDEEDEA